MSALDWFRIVAGFHYCLRRAITAIATRLACKTELERLAVAEAVESAE